MDEMFLIGLNNLFKIEGHHYLLLRVVFGDTQSVS
jgi:hypothetical protein